MTDTNAAHLFIKEETTWGTPVTTGTASPLRMTGETMKGTQENAVSDEILSDRQTAKIHRTSVGAAGSVSGELVMVEHEKMLQYGLQSPAGTATHSQAGATTTASNQFSHASFTAGNGYAAGKWVRSSGFTNAANNGYSKITVVANPDITVAGLTIVNSDTGTIDLMEQYVNGSTFTPFTLGKELAAGSEYARYPGCYVVGFTISGTAKGIITVSFDLIGKLEESQSSHWVTSTDAILDYPAMNAVDHMNSAIINEANSATEVTGFQFSVANSLRPREVMGNLGPTSIGNGSIVVSGNVTKYFAAAADMDPFLNFTASSFAVALQDDLGNGMVIDCPAIRFTDGSRPVAGKDQDVIASRDFQCEKDSAQDIMITINTWDEAAPA